MIFNSLSNSSSEGVVFSHGLNLEISNRQLERVSETRLLGVKFQENLKWSDHVKDIANASDGVLCTLRKFKHFTDFHLRKKLANSLVLSRTSIPIPENICPLHGQHLGILRGRDVLWAGNSRRMGKGESFSSGFPGDEELSLKPKQLFICKNNFIFFLFCDKTKQTDKAIERAAVRTMNCLLGMVDLLSQ